jgi:hypothetical protein
MQRVVDVTIEVDCLFGSGFEESLAMFWVRRFCMLPHVALRTGSYAGPRDAQGSSTGDLVASAELVVVGPISP